MSKLNWFKSAKKRISHFFNQHLFLRDVLIGAGVGILVVGATAATIATFGAAAPALGVSFGALVSVVGSAQITAVISIGFVAATSLIAGLVGRLKRWFSKKKPPSPQQHVPLEKQLLIPPRSNNKQDSFPLSQLPKEIRQNHIYPRTPLSVLGLLAQTSKQYEAETAFLRLLQASIHAAPEFLNDKEDAFSLASIAILKKHPELLFIKKQVTDHYSREIWASPYQIFLGAGDIWALKQIQKNVLPLIENGQAQAVCIPIGTNAVSSMKSNIDSGVTRTLIPALLER
jgi:hypothetical protein